MELNDEDAGEYQFILATNDEVVETTYERMKNVSVDLPMNLKYLKTDFISKSDNSLELTLLNNVKTLIELENGVDLDESDIALVANRSVAINLDVEGIRQIYMRTQTHEMLSK